MQDESDVIFFKDSHGCHLEVNRGFERLFKVSRQMIARRHPPTETVLKRLEPALLKEILDEEREYFSYYPKRIFEDEDKGIIAVELLLSNQPPTDLSKENDNPIEPQPE